MKSNNSLTNAQLFLLAGLFLATAPDKSTPECCNSDDFMLPADKDSWAPVYTDLRDKGILNDDNNLTAYGKHRAHKACSEGVNFKRMAERNPNVAIAMLASSVEAIKEHDNAEYNFSDKALQLFATVSADLAFLSLPVETEQAA